jgi:hypothetical protein
VSNWFQATGIGFQVFVAEERTLASLREALLEARIRMTDLGYAPDGPYLTPETCCLKPSIRAPEN